MVIIVIKKYSRGNTNNMKYAFFLGSASVGGGTYVIFQHAIYIKKQGNDVAIITKEPVDKKELYWHKEAETLTWKTIDEASKLEFDVVIATWWRLVYDIYRVKAKRYIYFVQSIESKFYPESEKPIRQLAEATYMLPMDVVTEASWIKEYLEEKYEKTVLLARNGIRKDIYKSEGECCSTRKKGKLRVLVEGPIDVDFKNVPKTIELCKQSKADEIWLMTASDIKKYPGVDKVFSKVPIYDTPKIYRSCDVIIKLSYVEGMFGPPLEMYHCGGTSITYDVTGYDEYIKHNYNGLVVEKDNDKKVVEYINLLKDNPDFLDKLKKGALTTAKEWIDWNRSSEVFYNNIIELYSNNHTITQSRIEKESKFHFESYVIAEDYLNYIKAQGKKGYIIKIKKVVSKILPECIKKHIRKIIYK